MSGDDTPCKNSGDRAEEDAAEAGPGRGGGVKRGRREGGKQSAAGPVERGEGGDDTVVVVLAPLPYHIPPQPYAHRDGGGRDLPWSWDKTYTKPDVLGRSRKV